MSIHQGILNPTNKLQSEKKKITDVWNTTMDTLTNATIDQQRISLHYREGYVKVQNKAGTKTYCTLLWKNRGERN